MNLPPHSLAPDLAIHRAPQTLYGLPALHPRTPAQILRANHHRRPLRCDTGTVSANLARLQSRASAASFTR